MSTVAATSHDHGSNNQHCSSTNNLNNQQCYNHSQRNNHNNQPTTMAVTDDAMAATNANGCSSNK